MRYNIYTKNETYIVNEKMVEKIEELKAIVDAEEPYSNIHRIPGLREEFNNIFTDLLEEKSKPVREYIENDRQKVEEELMKDDFDEYFKGTLLNRFKRLLERLDKSNTINEIIAMPQESDVIKVNCFKDIEKEHKRLQEEISTKIGEKHDEEDGQDPEPVPTPVEVKTLSLTNLVKGTRNIESEEDVEEFVNEIRQALLKILNEEKNIKLI